MNKEEIVSNRAIKQRDNKEKLLNDLVSNLFENVYENEDYLRSLTKEALKTRTQRELKQILYGE